MYVPDAFSETDFLKITQLIDEFPLAMFVACKNDDIIVHHIPMIMDGKSALVAHIAKANDLHKKLQDNDLVKIIFRGADGYVSPNWYPSKMDTHRAVPTWNYQAVHVSGHVQFIHSEREKRAIVGRMTQKFERMLTDHDPWRMADAPKDYMDNMINAVVGMRIVISDIIAKSKLSQNRAHADVMGAVKQFQQRGLTKLASKMAEHQKKKP